MLAADELDGEVSWCGLGSACVRDGVSHLGWCANFGTLDGGKMPESLFCGSLVRGARLVLRVADEG